MEDIQDSYRIVLQKLEGWHWKECSLTEALCLTGAVIVATTLIWRYSNATNGKKVRKSPNHENQKTATHDIPLSRELHIDNIAMTFQQEYRPGLLLLLEKYDSHNEKDVYNRRYYNEMLLKLLLELDAIDITELPKSEKIYLKNKRKTVIKNIQHHLQLLDILPRN